MNTRKKRRKNSSTNLKKTVDIANMLQTTSCEAPIFLNGVDIIIIDVIFI